MFLFVQVNYGAIEWLLIGHYWLASVFMYLFLRDTGLKRLGALGGGVTFAFCGFMVAHLGHLPMVPVATWIPLVLLSLRRADKAQGRQGWAWTIGAGLFMAMSLLAGHVQIFAYGLMAAGLLWVVLLLTTTGGHDGDEPPHRVLRTRFVVQWAIKGLVALALALAIGAIQLLPSLELSTQSVRASVSYEEASAFPAQPITLLNLVLPTVYGSNPTNYAFGQYQTTENWGYCGVITLALAALGLLLRRTRMATFFALLVILSIIIMVGDLTILSGWIYKFVPGFNKLRDSGRALVLLGLGLAGLAGYGLDGLVSALGNMGGSRRNLMWWLVGVTGVVALATFGIMPALFMQVLAVSTAQYGRLPGAINDLGMLIVWLGLLAGLGWAAYRRRLTPTWTGGLVFGLLVLDIFSPNSRFNPTTENVIAGFQHFDAISFLVNKTADERTGIPLRVNSDTNVQDNWQPSNAVLYDLYDTGGAWNPLKLERYDYLWTLAKNYPDTPLYDLTGAAYEVVSATTTLTTTPHAGQPKWESAYEEAGLQIFHDKNALPRAFLVHDAVVEHNPESIVVALRRFDINPAHTVILESGSPSRSKDPGSAEAGTSSGESVRATRYASNDVDITVKAATPGWLVLTDAWYPGWQASVDGGSVPIEHANFAYRAIRVEAGEHRVSMRFRPATWVQGRIVSLVGLVAAVVGLAALLLWSRIRRKAS